MNQETLFKFGKNQPTSEVIDKINEIIAASKEVDDKKKENDFFESLRLEYKNIMMISISDYFVCMIDNHEQIFRIYKGFIRGIYEKTIIIDDIESEGTKAINQINKQ